MQTSLRRWVPLIDNRHSQTHLHRAKVPTCVDLTFSLSATFAGAIAIASSAAAVRAPGLEHTACPVFRLGRLLTQHCAFCSYAVGMTIESDVRARTFDPPGTSACLCVCVLFAYVAPPLVHPRSSMPPRQAANIFPIS